MLITLHYVVQSNNAKEVWLEMDVGDHVTERVEWAEVIGWLHPVCVWTTGQ